MRARSQFSSERRTLVQKCVPPVVDRKRGGPPSIQKVVLLLLVEYGDVSWPSITTLAKLACVEERTVKGAIRALQSWGAVTVSPRKRLDGSSRSNLYSLNFEAIAAHQATERDLADDALVDPDAPMGISVAPDTAAHEAPPLNLPLNLTGELRGASPTRPARTVRKKDTPEQGRLIEEPSPPPKRSESPPAGLTPPNAAHVQDAYAKRYERRYGTPPAWTGQHAKAAKGLLTRLESTAAKLKPPGEVPILLGRVLDAFLADEDRFLAGRSHNFADLPNVLGKYVKAIVGSIGAPIGSGNKRGAW